MHTSDMTYTHTRTHAHIGTESMYVTTWYVRWKPLRRTERKREKERVTTCHQAKDGDKYLALSSMVESERELDYVFASLAIVPSLSLSVSLFLSSLLVFSPCLEQVVMIDSYLSQFSPLDTRCTTHSLTLSLTHSHIHKPTSDCWWRNVDHLVTDHLTESRLQCWAA